jgi:hypothetical protein
MGNRLAPQQGKYEDDEMKKKAEMFEKLKKPDVCNIIVSADDDRHPWYKDAASPQPAKSEELMYSVVSQKLTKIQEDYEIQQRILREQAIKVNRQTITDAYIENEKKKYT